MDVKKYLILVHKSNDAPNVFHDETDKIASILKPDKDNKYYRITYKKSNSFYNFNSINVIYCVNPDNIDLASVKLISKNPRISIKNIDCLLKFDNYYKLFYVNHNSVCCTAGDLDVRYSCIQGANRAAKVLEYFRTIVKEMSDDEDIAYLKSNFEKLDFIDTESVLAGYLNNDKIKMRKRNKPVIFPFNCNKSQMEAVENALTNNISVIQGPPGTGKTQTILNIIANLIYSDKNIAVISSNNEAIKNVQDKLEEKGFSFITALLGNTENKKDFFDNIKYDGYSFDKLADALLLPDKDERYFLDTYDRLISLGKLENEQAELREQLRELRLEYTHFCDEHADLSRIRSVYWSRFSKISASSDFINIYAKIHNKSYFNFFIRLKHAVEVYVKYRLFGHLLPNAGDKGLSLFLLDRFYFMKKIELSIKIEKNRQTLENKNFKQLQDEYREESLRVFKRYLFKKHITLRDVAFTRESYLRDFNEFIMKYPVIFSTAHSILASVKEDFLFDYLIIDEASQLDIIPACLALKCCKNIVIVGDSKQLAPVLKINSRIVKKYNDIFYRFFPEGSNYDCYRYIIENKNGSAECNSVLESFISAYGKYLPQKMLVEHYRCDPDIIGFCNRRFYENRLVIMSESGNAHDTLILYSTQPDNLRKDVGGKVAGSYSMKQVDEICDVILKEFPIFQNEKSIGIATPFKKQVERFNSRLGEGTVFVNTVHKYQGRETNVMIFSTVKGETDKFLNDPRLVNVAVSRAKKHLIVVADTNKFTKPGSCVGDLINYVKYNSELGNASIHTGKIYSVFDLFYKYYSRELVPLNIEQEKMIERLLRDRDTNAKALKKNKAELIIYTFISIILRRPEYRSLSFKYQWPLSMVIRDLSLLNDREKNFVKNKNSHFDFIIYDRYSKRYAAAIEVDGVTYHRKGSRQETRDIIKDGICGKYGLEILRLRTDCNSEEEKIVSLLNEIVVADESITI